MTECSQSSLRGAVGSKKDGFGKAEWMQEDGLHTVREPVLDFLFRCTEQGIALACKAGRLLKLNEPLGRWVGQDRLHASEEGVCALLSPEHRPALFHAMHTIASGETSSWQAEVDVLAMGGARFPAQARMEGIPGGDGKLLYYLLHLKKLAQKQEELGGLLASAIRQFPEMITVKDGQGRWLESNELCLRALGLAEVEYRGKTDEELASYSQQAASVFAECIRTDEMAWASGRPMPFLERMIGPEGPRTMEILKVPLFHSDGSRKGIITICRDESTWERKLDELEKKETLYRSLVEETMAGVFLYSRGKARYLNARFAEILGYSPEEIEGQPLLSFVPKEERSALLAAMRAGWRRSAPPQPASCRAIRKDGSPVELEVHSRLTTFRGKLAVIGTILDRTEQNRAEELLRKQEKLSVVGQLAAGMAHEIRNPLTSLNGFLYLLQTRIQGPRHYFTIMQEELKRINAIVNEFLILANPQTDGYRVHSLGDLLLDVYRELEDEAAGKRIGLSVSPGEGEALVLCEANLLKQAFVHIGRNGLEATSPGGRLEMAVEQGKDERHCVRFTDNGRGIPEERRSRLGEPFYTTKEKGTGLGLTLVFKVVEAHGGTLEINSRINSGTTVLVYLPPCK
ncbi:hypothetical protein J31TS4_04930 [Paenibacillus sp. J31TS4]|uniref:PAS domain-containing sensor histidine kinase n=1 Tax=Paenibacillus sp. J31TS4 TaxID=2807195 RepID=UPI001AFFB89E|nr:PAS domain-containing sensor histidine kinase [Paenibacillus sp. J31TS4]GIP37213.1 hypothetical protein J31TS4_04930 [Paenibacillus sp. J31TS4]